MDNRWAISTGDDEILRVWDIETRSPLRVLEIYGDWPKTLAITADNQYILSAGNGYIRVLALESGVTIRTLRGHRGTINAIALTADGQYVLSASDDRTLRIWDPERGTETDVWRGHAAQVVTLALARDGRFAVSGSRDETDGRSLSNTTRARPRSVSLLTKPTGYVLAH